MINKIDHIGIAVRSLEESIPVFRDLLRLDMLEIEEVSDQMVRVAKFRVGETDIELLEPTSSESPIAKFIDKRGQGIHHIAFATDCIDEELERIEKSGGSLINKNPRMGAEGKKIAFLHPRSTAKVLTEICEG